ncbi:MAG: cobalt-precorrin-6A reductase [unclassified Hahellaceae]|nr:cobalt-precorrin-6A reductase [Hahellaceae bacterium]|tara:strand:- start:9148 stop:9900 length:753 start_codon:yes stop_codon:yes gene_type:complete
MHVLILGGTRDAMNLAAVLLHDPRFEATYSLAGRTRRPLPSGLPTRRGGFGGIAGLVQWLQDHGAAAVVDATHPFAAQMSANAVAACRMTGLPLLRLGRPAWTPVDGDHWYDVPDLDAAAVRLGEVTEPGQNVLLTTGGTTLRHFESMAGLHFVVRCVDPPEPPPAFASWTLITDRGPFDLAGEQALLSRYGIDIVVTKNSGGLAAQPKLGAARHAGLPVIMVERPELPSADHELYSVEDVIANLEALRG